MERAIDLILPTTIHGWVFDTRTLRRSQEQRFHNAVLVPGRIDALKMLYGLKSFGAYRWIELGTNGLSAGNTQVTGCISPLLLPDGATPYRAEGAWAFEGNEFTFTATIYGTDIEGAVRELAIYPSQLSGQGPALYRYVPPTAWLLNDSNALAVSISVTP